VTPTGDADSTGERESVRAGFSLLQLDDLELAYGSRRLSEELGLTASDIWVTLVAPGQVIALDRPEHERSVILAYRGEIDIEWDDFSVLHLRPGDLAWVHPPMPRALHNTGGEDAAFLTFSAKDDADSRPQT
jgi:uncharacterized cupin superfamily protein